MEYQQKQEQLYEQAQKFALPVLGKYYPEHTRIHDILFEHSTQVAGKLLRIAKARPDLNADWRFVYEAAFLHDIGIFMCNAPSIECFGTHLYIEHGYLGADLLRSMNLSRHALVAERHTGTGITKEQIEREHLPLPDNRIYEPQTIEEQLVAYADKFYSKTRVGQETPMETVRKKMEKFGENSVAKFDQWVQLFSE